MVLTRAKRLMYIGLLLGFIGAFLSFYEFTANLVDGETVSKWNYYILLGMIGDSTYAPQERFSPEISILYILLLLIISFSIVFGKNKIIKNVMPYLNGAIVVIQCVLIIGFPLVFLISNHLYYPVISMIEGNTVLTYSLGPGYFITLVSFLLIFPKAASDVFYHFKDSDLKENDYKEIEIPDSIDLEREIAIERAELKNVRLENEKITKKSR